LNVLPAVLIKLYIQIFPAFTQVARTAPARMQDYYLQQLAILIEIVKEHVRNYVPELLKMIVDLWDNAALQSPIVTVIESLGKALDSEFKPFLPSILPVILRIFDAELTEKRQQTQTKIFTALLTLGSNVEEYMHLIIPIIVKTFERSDANIALRRAAIVSIEGLSRRVNFSDHASRVIHPLVRTLGTSSNELRIAIMDAFCAMVVQLGCDFANFIPTISKVGVPCCTTLHSVKFIFRLWQNTRYHLLNMTIWSSSC
jgi:serine/threonine-protein kinase mTOR